MEKAKISLKIRRFFEKIQKTGNLSKVGTDIALKIDRNIC